MEDEIKRFKKLGSARYYSSLKQRYPNLTKNQLKSIVKKMKEIADEKV